MLITNITKLQNATDFIKAVKNFEITSFFIKGIMKHKVMMMNQFMWSFFVVFVILIFTGGY